MRIIWLAADTSGLRLRAKIMKAFMGRFGVPSALRDWAIRELAKAEPSLSSVRTGRLSKARNAENAGKERTAGVGRLEFGWEAVRRVARVGGGVI